MRKEMFSVSEILRNLKSVLHHHIVDKMPNYIDTYASHLQCLKNTDHWWKDSITLVLNQYCYDMQNVSKMREIGLYDILLGVSSILMYLYILLFF